MSISGFDLELFDVLAQDTTFFESCGLDTVGTQRRFYLLPFQGSIPRAFWKAFCLTAGMFKFRPWLDLRCLPATSRKVFLGGCWLHCARPTVCTE